MIYYIKRILFISIYQTFPQYIIRFSLLPLSTYFPFSVFLLLFCWKIHFMCSWKTSSSSGNNNKFIYFFRFCPTKKTFHFNPISSIETTTHHPSNATTSQQSNQLYIFCVSAHWESPPLCFSCLSIAAHTLAPKQNQPAIHI